MVVLGYLKTMERPEEKTLCTHSDGLKRDCSQTHHWVRGKGLRHQQEQQLLLQLVPALAPYLMAPRPERQDPCGNANSEQDRILLPYHLFTLTRSQPPTLHQHLGSGLMRSPVSAVRRQLPKSPQTTKSLFCLQFGVAAQKPPRLPKVNEFAV